jgi:hypothetical protein
MKSTLDTKCLSCDRNEINQNLICINIESIIKFD